MIPVKCYPMPFLELRLVIKAASRTCPARIVLPLLAGLIFAESSNAAIIDMTPPGFVVSATNSPSSVIMSLNGQNLTNVTSVTDDLVFNSGVVAWSSGSIIYSYVFDYARGRWIGTNSSQGPTSDLSTGDGVVAWSTSNGAFYRTYDPGQGRWITGSGPGPISEPRLLNTNGVVAWSVGSAMFCRVYDPTRYEPIRNGWQTNSVTMAGSTFDLTTYNGVVACTAGSLNTKLHLRIYDPAAGVWKILDQAVGFTSSIQIQGSTVFASTTGGEVARGYNPASGAWGTTGGIPLAYFAVSTNSGNVPLTVTFIDMSIGGFNWSWNFGDNIGSSVRRSAVYRYTTHGRFTAIQTVSGTSANRVIVTDTIAPTGTNRINNGAAITTNQVVTLNLDATDNSGLVTDMRFSNDSGMNWSPWEPFLATRSWTLSPGNGPKTVLAQFRDAAGNTSSPPASASIQLDTSPPPTANFASASVNESAGSATISVMLDHPYSLPVSVSFSTVSGTATASLDYGPTNGLIVFPPNATSASFTVPVVLDGLVELNETVFLEFTGATNAQLGPVGTLTILDDDAPTVSFAATSFIAAENSGAAAIAVRLSAPSGRPVSVHYEATNGTALGGSDFGSADGTVSFAPGETNASFLVTLLDDSVDELSETVSLILSSPTNAVFGLQSTATLTITDDDKPLVFFASPTYSFFETNGVVRMSVRLSKPFSQNVEVDYEAIGGTATPGDDYIFPLGTLTIGAGETNRDIAINLRNDSQVEPDENIRMQITGIRGAGPGPRLEADLIIFDDDGAPRPVAPSVSTNGLFEVAFTGGTGRVFTIEASTNLLNWSPVATLTNTTGTIRFADPASPGIPNRFYRSWTP